MAGVRALIARTRRLEAANVHPMLAALGGEHGWYQIQTEVENGIARGMFDNRDMPFVMEALGSWLGISPY